MEKKEAGVTKVISKGDFLEITVLMPKSRVLDNDRILGYEHIGEIKRAVINLLASEIFKSKGKKIIQEVLKNVNWSEVVRSDISQKVIKAISTGQFEDRRY